MKQPVSNGSEEIVGKAWCSNTADGTGDASRMGVVNPYDDSNLKMQLKPPADTTAAVGDTLFGLGSPTIIYTFTARIPILGWEAKIGRSVEGK